MALSVSAMSSPGFTLNVEATVSSRATFMPNTFKMQEFARMSLDEHLEDLEGGRSFREPVILAVRKGRLDLAQ